MQPRSFLSFPVEMHTDGSFMENYRINEQTSIYTQESNVEVTQLQQKVYTVKEGTFAVLQEGYKSQPSTIYGKTSISPFSQNVSMKGLMQQSMQTLSATGVFQMFGFSDRSE